MKHILSYLTITLLFTSCQLFEPKPESEKFYCKINGRAWRPEKKTLPTLSTNPLRAEWNKKGRFNINAYNGNECLTLTIKVEQDGLKLKTYDLDTLNSIGRYYYNYALDPIDREALNSLSGIVNIIKLQNNRVSGTFEFETYSKKKKKTYKITKGQFNDLTYSEIG